MLRRVGQLLERVERLQVQQPAELVVARHAALARAQDVDRGEVDERSVGPVEVLEEARVVVQRDRARMRRAERVEEVGHRHLVEPLAHVQRAELGQRALLQHRVVGERAEAVVVRDQRVHAVDGDELLGERVRDAVVVGRRAGDAADHLVRRAPAEQLVEPLALEAPPVRAQREHRRRVGDDRRRPVDRVDLRHQRRDDEPRLVVELVVGELRIARVQVVADRVVLAHEERVQQREPDPEVAGDAGEVDVRLELLRRAGRARRAAACRARRSAAPSANAGSRP